MRKLIYSTNITLDGFIDHTAMIADEELHEKSSQLLREGDLLLFGRKAYQLMADYWPNAPADPSLSPDEREFAEAINPMEKIVFSKTLETVSWNTRILREVNPEEIRALKLLPGRDILLGPGAEIVQAFMELDLIDEYRFWIHPVILGNGIPLFKKQDQRKDLTLTGQNRFRSGVMELIYRANIASG